MYTFNAFVCVIVIFFASFQVFKNFLSFIFNTSKNPLPTNHQTHNNMSQKYILHFVAFCARGYSAKSD